VRIVVSSSEKTTFPAGIAGCERVTTPSNPPIQLDRAASGH
jgi:hypothetical protein